MIYLQKKIIARYVVDEHCPEKVTKKKWYPVIGFRTIINENKKECLYYIIIDNSLKIVFLASWNCDVAIDHNAELNSNSLLDSLGKLVNSVEVIIEKVGTGSTEKSGNNGNKPCEEKGDDTQSGKQN